MGRKISFSLGTKPDSSDDLEVYRPDEQLENGQNDSANSLSEVPEDDATESGSASSLISSPKKQVPNHEKKRRTSLESRYKPKNGLSGEPIYYPRSNSLPSIQNGSGSPPPPPYEQTEEEHIGPRREGYSAKQTRFAETPLDDVAEEDAAEEDGALQEASLEEDGDQDGGDNDDTSEMNSEINSDSDSMIMMRPATQMTRRKFSLRNSKLAMRLFPNRKDSLMVYGNRLPDNDDEDDETAEETAEESGDTQTDEESYYPKSIKIVADQIPHREATRSILKKRASIVQINDLFKESLITILSGIYAMIIVIMGAVVPLSELFAEKSHPGLIEGFYIYLYSASIVFIAYVYVYLLREKRLNLRRKFSLRRSNSTASSDSNVPKKRRRRRVSIDHVGSHETGSFYLRLGAVAFGIGSMIQSGLHFGVYFETSRCNNILSAIRPILQMMFTFIQMYYIFMNSKMCINRFRAIARFGMMHVVATNLCVWFSNIIEETKHAHEHQISHGSEATHGGGEHAAVTAPSHVAVAAHHEVVAPHHESVVYNVTDSHHSGHGTGHGIALSVVANLTSHDRGSVAGHGASLCDEGPSLIGNVVQAAGPYLYPCSIEYSLICAGVIYVIWKNIGKNKVSRSYSIDDGDDDEKAKEHRMSVDCTHSSKGLFLGIFTLVGAVISTIVFFMMIQADDYQHEASLIKHLTEISLHVLSIFALIVAYMRMKPLRYNTAKEVDLEEILLLISLTGEYVYAMFSLIAAAFHATAGTLRSNLVIATSVLCMCQATFQTVFMLNGHRRAAYKPLHEKYKPGREYVMFLLMLNVALWGINTFEKQRWESNPIQVDYYGALAWNIFMHISVPLSIFFRFHSTVCLSNIWKMVWKRKSL